MLRGCYIVLVACDEGVAWWAASSRVDALDGDAPSACKLPLHPAFGHQYTSLSVFALSRPLSCMHSLPDDWF